MLEVLQYIFSDFWRFLQACILLMIIAMWHPISIVIKTRQKNEED